MSPKKDKKLRDENGRKSSGATYAQMIADALRSELGETHRATKTVMRWTGASESAVKQWLSGGHGPGGDYLIGLMRESDEVFERVLTAAGRRDAVIAARLLGSGELMLQALSLVDRGSLVFGSDPDDAIHDASVTPVTSDTAVVNDRVNVRLSDRVKSLKKEGLNVRQRWYMDSLASGARIRSIDIQQRWGVSEKTARRDVAELKGRGLIRFVGAFRTGGYRLSG